MAKQTFTTGQVLTAAQMTSLQQTAMGGGSATTKTASYVLVAADAGTTVTMTSASATTITVNTALFAAGDTVYIQNLGAGVSTITAGTATVNTSATLALAQYEGGQLYFNSTSAAIFIKGAGAGVSGPAFVAYRSGNQTVTANTATKLALNAETFDTDNCFDSTTNYRFTPTTAGKYTVGLNMYISGAGYCMIYKNGAEIYRIQYINANESGGSSVLIDMNGSTDYLEFFGFTAGVTFYGGSSFTFAWANWERA